MERCNSHCCGERVKQPVSIVAKSCFDYIFFRRGLKNAAVQAFHSSRIEPICRTGIFAIRKMRACARR